jgi:hypothetical protein
MLSHPPQHAAQGCCFVKFNGIAAAQAAIAALHNQRSLPPLRNPLQVVPASRPHSPRCVRITASAASLKRSSLRCHWRPK